MGATAQNADTAGPLSSARQNSLLVQGYGSFPVRPGLALNHRAELKPKLPIRILIVDK